MKRVRAAGRQPFLAGCPGTDRTLRGEREPTPLRTPPGCYAVPMPPPATAVRRATRPTQVALEEYPCSDGRVLMETDPHANAIVAMRNQLQWHFEGRPDVYVAGSMALYYREGDPRAVVAPDVFVVVGAAKGDRRSYRTWDEGGLVPAFVVEVCWEA